MRELQHVLAETQTIAGRSLNQLREDLKFTPDRVFITHKQGFGLPTFPNSYPQTSHREAPMG